MPTATNPKSSYSRIVFLALAALAYWLLNAANHDLWGPDETRYTQVARELLGRGNWLLLTLHGEPYDEKPPLPFWILAAMLSLKGGAISELLLRLPSILAGLATLLLTYDIGRKRYNAMTGWLAAVMLATTPVFIDNAALVRLDMPLAAWTTLSIWAWMTRAKDERLGALRIALFWIGILGGFFTKGPIILLFVAPVMAWECLAAKSWRPMRAIGIFWGLATLAIAAVIWFIGQARSAGINFVFNQIHDQTVQRFNEGAHAAPFYYYIEHFYIFAPWVLILIPLCRELWRSRKVLPREGVALLDWTLIPLIIFSIAHGKRQVYLLPLAPGVALLAAWYAAPFVERGLHWRRASQALTALAAVMGSAFLLLLIAIHIRPSLIFNAGMHFHAVHILIFAAVAAGLLALAAQLRKSDGELLKSIHALALFVAACVICEGLVFQPGANHSHTPRYFSQQLETILKSRGENKLGGVKDAGIAEYHVYGNYKVMELGRDAMTAPLRKDLPNVLVVREDERKKFDDLLAQAGYAQFERGEVDGDGLIIYARPALAKTP